MTDSRIVDLLGNGINLELDGVQIAQIQIPSGHVPYSFMPLIDQHLVITGDLLRNGMIVVIADHMHRENPEVLNPEYPSRRQGFRPTDYDRRRVQETSRWALVTDFEKRGEIVSFTAIYADGTMSARGGYNQSIKWAVLKKVELVPAGEPCVYCHQVHGPEKTARTIADDPEKQPFYDILDETAKFIGSFLFPDASDAERIISVKEAVSGVVDEIKDELKTIFNEDDLEAETPGEGQREGETSDEYADRLRDEAEAAGEYDASEAVKIQQTRLADEALEILREKLRGDAGSN